MLSYTIINTIIHLAFCHCNSHTRTLIPVLYIMGVGGSAIQERGVLWISMSVLLLGLADASGDATVFDIGSNLDPFKYTVVRV